MKKILCFLLLVVSILFFTGCPKTENPTAGTDGGGGGNPGNGTCAKPELGTAVDSSLCFTTGGDADWVVQTVTVFTGTQAVASGLITATGQATYIQTIVTGPGILKFRIKTSCNYSAGFGDSLTIYMNDNFQYRIGGINTSWVPITFTVETGSFTFKWEYKKNSSYPMGEDKAWLDDVQFIPQGTPEPTPVVKPWGCTTTAAGFGQRESFGYCVLNDGSGDKMYVVGGALVGVGGQDDVWATANGKDWYQIASGVPFGNKWGHAVTTHKPVSWPAEAIYVIAGYQQGGGLSGSGDVKDVWFSGNGVDWELATGNIHANFQGRRFTAAVSYNNKLWVIGGYDGSYLNDVWYSDDGYVWGCTTTAAAFTGRYGHSLVVFNGKMWVIGGFDGGSGNSLTNDVWYSSDGANWIQATGNAGFYSRSQHCSVVYDNKIWVIGGSGYLPQEVWYSEDGINWNYAPAPEWDIRHCFGAVTFDNGSGLKLWVFGGAYGMGTYGSAPWKHEDVWYTEKN